MQYTKGNFSGGTSELLKNSGPLLRTFLGATCGRYFPWENPQRNFFHGGRCPRVTPTKCVLSAAMHKISAIIFLGICVSCSLMMAGEEEERRSYPMGSIGGRVGVDPGQSDLLVTMITPGQAGEKAGLKVGDYIIGLEDKPFTKMLSTKDSCKVRSGPIETLGLAIDMVSGNGSPLKLMVKRRGRDMPVTVKLPKNGSFNATTFPYDCKKSALIYDVTCECIAKELLFEWPAHHGGGGSDIMARGLAALALLGRADGKYRKEVDSYFHQLAERCKRTSFESDEVKWRSFYSPPYAGAFLCEYYMKNPSPAILEAINAQAEFCAKLVNFANKSGGPNGPYFEGGYHPFWGLITGSYLWFFAQAERCGADTKIFSREFKLLYRSLIDRSMDKRGGILYTYWPGLQKTQPEGSERINCAFRNGPACVAAFHMRETPLMLKSAGISANNSIELGNIWTDRMAVDSPALMQDVHTVSAWPMAVGMAGIASNSHEKFVATMALYKWYYALTFEPDPTAKSERWVAGYVPGRDAKLGGDGYMNGVRDGIDWESVSPLQTAVVAFVLAAKERSLSFYGIRKK